MACFWVSLAFPFVTRIFWPWNKSWWGWNIVLLDLSIAGTLFPSWFYMTFHVSDIGLLWAEVIFLGLVVVNVVWRTVIIWRTQRRGDLREEEPG
jgi:hypothetical protein